MTFQCSNEYLPDIPMPFNIQVILLRTACRNIISMRWVVWQIITIQYQTNLPRYIITTQALNDALSITLLLFFECVIFSLLSRLLKYNVISVHIYNGANSNYFNILIASILLYFIRSCQNRTLCIQKFYSEFFMFCHSEFSIQKFRIHIRKLWKCLISF